MYIINFEFEKLLCFVKVRLLYLYVLKVIAWICGVTHKCTTPFSTTTYYNILSDACYWKCPTRKGYSTKTYYATLFNNCDAKRLCLLCSSVSGFNYLKCFTQFGTFP